MSQENEHKSKKGGTKVGAVIILIISAIVFLPAGGAAVYQGLFNKNKAPVFGSFNGTKITYEPNSKFVQNASNIMEQYKRYGIQVTEQYYYYIFNQAFNQTLVQLAYSSAVEKAGYKVPVAAVNREVLPYFNDENGVFSQKLYNQADVTELNKLRSSIEDALTTSRYAEDIFGTSKTVNGNALYGLKSTKAEADFIAEMGAEKHSFQLAAFNTENFPESEVIKYAKNNAENFTRYDISAITVDTESDAKAILKQLKNNEITFEDAVADKSAKYYTDSEGKLSGPYRYQISDMVEDESNASVIINLSKDTLSSVIQTKHGYSIFRNDGDAVSADFNDSALTSVVKNYINENAAGYIEEYYTEIAKDFASEAALSSFEKACKRYNVEAVEVPAFPLNYGNTSFYDPSTETSEIASVSSNSEALQSMFALKQNEISSPLVIDSKVVVIKCTGIQKNAADDTVAAKIPDADKTSAQTTLMASDKVVNNFIETYISSVMNK